MGGMVPTVVSEEHGPSPHTSRVQGMVCDTQPKNLPLFIRYVLGVTFSTAFFLTIYRVSVFPPCTNLTDMEDVPPVLGVCRPPSLLSHDRTSGACSSLSRRCKSSLLKDSRKPFARLVLSSDALIVFSAEEAGNAIGGTHPSDTLVLDLRPSSEGGECKCRFTVAERITLSD